MRIDCLKTIEAFKQLEPCWNQLVKQSGRENPFLSYEWIDCWLENYAEEYQPYLIVVYDQETPIAFAPLAIDSDKQLVFMGYPYNDFANFIITQAHEQCIDEVFHFLRDHQQDWNKIVLDQLPDDSRLYKYLTQHTRDGLLPYFIQTSDTCPEMIITDPDEARKKYNKKHVKTHSNWFKKQGDLHHQIPDTVDETIDAMSSLFELHIDRRDKTPHPSHFIEDKNKQFYIAFIKRLFPSGYIRISRLSLDEKDLAMFLFFQMGHTLFLYTTSFDDTYYKRSPGQISLRHIMDYAIENEFTKIDFARGDEGYKDRYTNTVKQNYLVTVFSSRFRQRVYANYYAFKRSSFINLVYRNKRTQSAKANFLYHRRKTSLFRGFTEALKIMFTKKPKRS